MSTIHYLLIASCAKERARSLEHDSQAEQHNPDGKLIQAGVIDFKSRQGLQIQPVAEGSSTFADVARCCLKLRPPNSCSYCEVGKPTRGGVSTLGVRVPEPYLRSLP